MKPVTSVLVTAVLIPVLLGVMFGILTDSRNSILIKEIVYVAGGSVLALMAGVFLLMRREGRYGVLNRYSLAILAVLTIYMVLRHFTGIGSVNGPFTILMFFSLALSVVAVLPFLERKHMMLFLAVLTGSAFIVYIYAVLQWQGIHLFLWDAGLTRTGRSTGSLGNPNLLGGFASAFLPLGAVRILTAGRGSATLRKVSAGVFTVLSVLAIVASGTRGSIAGLAAGCAVLAVLYLRSSGVSRSKMLLTAAVITAVVVASALPMSSRLSELSTSSGEQGTLQVRKVIWSGAFSVFMRSPVTGNGPGCFQILFPEYRNPSYSLLGVSHNTLHAHCEYLEILTDLGIIGLLLWGALVFFTVRGASGTPGDPVNYAAAAGICAMMVEALVSVHLRWPPTAWLLSVLVMVALSRPKELSKPGKWALPGAVLMFLGSCVLMWGLFAHYLPASKSSELVFRGKDMFLARTENALNSAYSSAIRWGSTGGSDQLNSAVNSWSYAAMCADSAVYYSRLATEVYPGDLGSWYALGSAHLTRYMVQNPPVTAMRNALECTGMMPTFPAGELQEELDLGMAAYDSLVTRAPFYAEVHNNLALGYSNMGSIDQALDELYISFLIHGHRRDDYFQQAVALTPLSTGSESGAALFHAHSLAEVNPDPARRGAVEGFARARISYILCHPNMDTDSMKILLREINHWYLAGTEMEGALESFMDDFSPERDHPFASWQNGSIQGSDMPDRFRLLREMTIQATHVGTVFPAVLTSDRNFYTAPAEYFIQSGFSSEYLPDLLRIFASQTALDHRLDQLYTLSYSERFSGKVDSGVLQRLNLVREASGGSRTAMRSGFQTPWLEGSFCDLLVDTLISLQSTDSLETRWYSLEMGLDLVLICSYWWGDNLFTTGQNQYLLERVFYCRDRLREISPDSWQYICLQVFDETDQAVFPWMQEPVSTVQLLRDDLISGVERAAP